MLVNIKYTKARNTEDCLLRVNSNNSAWKNNDSCRMAGKNTK